VHVTQYTRQSPADIVINFLLAYLCPQKSNPFIINILYHASVQISGSSNKVISESISKAGIYCSSNVEIRKRVYKRLSLCRLITYQLPKFFRLESASTHIRYSPSKHSHVGMCTLLSNNLHVVGCIFRRADLQDLFIKRF
jgi:Tfp pilus assembly protein FimT